MLKLSIPLAISLLLMGGMAWGQTDRVELDFESPDDLTHFRQVDEGTFVDGGVVAATHGSRPPVRNPRELALNLIGSDTQHAQSPTNHRA